MYTIDLDGEVAVVTGGGSGIGRAVAVLLAQAGAKVAVLDFNDEAAQETVELIRQADSTAESYQCDVSSQWLVGSVMAQVSSDLGDPSILVNVAGIWINGSVIEMPGHEAQRLLEVNLLGSLWAVRAAWPYMVGRGGGVVINVGSVQARGVFVEPNMYNVTKAGIETLTGMLAIEGGPHNIRVNCVAPGPVSTPGMGDWSAMPADFVNQWRTAIPAGRRGHAEEVAFAILMLCAPLATYVNGAVIPVDGGLPWERRPVTLLGPPGERGVQDDPDQQPREEQ